VIFNTIGSIAVAGQRLAYLLLGMLQQQATNRKWYSYTACGSNCNDLEFSWRSFQVWYFATVAELLVFV